MRAMLQALKLLASALFVIVPIVDAAGDRDRVALTTSATTILDGMVKAFLARPVSSFRKDEFKCTNKRIENLATDVMKAAQQTVFELSATLEPEGVQDVDGETRKSRPLPGTSHGLVTIIRLQGLLADDCKQGRSLDTFSLAEHHLRNLSYVGGHLVANGADIISELKDALASFRAGKLHAFGEDIGRAWRKVLLSKGSDMPTRKEAMRLTSEGLVEGFFSENVRLVTGHDFYLDLHKCINGQNERFFQEVWDAAWLFFEKGLAVGPVSDQRWKAVLAVVLADLPTAVRYCGLRKESSLMHSMEALEKMSFDIDATQRRVHTSEVSVDLAQAVDHWTQHRWHDFGMDLGKLLQGLVVLVSPPSYSEEYSVEGRLGKLLPSSAFQLPLAWLAAAAALVSSAIIGVMLRRGVAAAQPRCGSGDLLACSDLEGCDDLGIE